MEVEPTLVVGPPLEVEPTLEVEPPLEVAEPVKGGLQERAEFGEEERQG